MRRTERRVSVLCRVALAVGLTLAMSAAVAQAAPSDAAVRDCVVKNLPRYAVPDRAVVAQYVDVEQACRTALAGSSDPNVRITPFGGDGGTPTGGSAGGRRSGAPAPGDAPVTPRRADGNGVAGATPRAGGSGSGGGGTPSGTPGAADATGGTPAAADPAAAVERALAGQDAEASGPVPGDVGNLPWWAYLLGGGLVVMVAGVAAARLRAARGGGTDS